MKHFITSFIVLTVFVLCSSFTFAQDVIDVGQGYESLNIAIAGDTLPGGGPKSMNRVYRLERGGYYLLNGELGSVKDAPLRIVAAEGNGPMPVLIPAVNEAGAAGRCFRPAGDAFLQGLWATGIDNLGNQAEKNMIRADGVGARIIIDNCVLDYDAQSFCRMNAEDQKYYITNTTMRNSYLLADPNNGRFLDTRGNTMDSIFVQNCTFYVCSDNPMRSGDGIVKNFTLDHSTIYQAGGVFQVEGAINCTISNNLFVDFGFEGRAVDDSTSECVCPIDSLGADDLATDDQRHYMVKNNVLGLTPELASWISSVDSIVAFTFFNIREQQFIDTFPNMVEENNIEEYPVFSDPPDPNVIVTFADYRAKTGFIDEGNPDPAADRNGRSALIDDPTTAGPALDEFDFDYSTSSVSYTQAEGGFPVGDLNWFPDKKAEWEVWVATGVNRNESIPTDFILQQNFPNPFNPTTSIAYQLNKASDVKLTIFNSLGQKVQTLVDKRQTEGTHSIQWNGQDESGNTVASGLYIYRLETGNQVQVKKMMLMK